MENDFYEIVANYSFHIKKKKTEVYVIYKKTN